MLPSSSLATTSRLPLELDRLPWLRRLAVDYVSDYSRVSAFFSGNPADPDAWRDAIARRHRSGLTGAAIAPIVAAQQQRRNAPAAARAAAERLAQPDRSEEHTSELQSH